MSPIRPENRDRYPKNWLTEIRPAILKRAENCCERCGIPNGSLHPETEARIVLTIMHLNHIPEDCRPENLRAACQECHNSYDAPHRAAGRKRRRMESIEKTQSTLNLESNTLRN